MKRRCTALLICLIFLCQTAAGFSAASPNQTALSEEIKERADFLIENITNPQVGTIGGEWAVFGLARSNHTVPDGFYNRYFANVEKALTDTKGMLGATSYTEYSRMIIALSAIGKDVTDVAGYNLLEKISDLKNVKMQGISGPIFALMAFDTKGYAIPSVASNEIQATREGLIEEILRREVTDGGLIGGFSLSQSTPDPDITARVLQVLAPYRRDSKVAAVIGRALLALQRLQQPDGGYVTGLDGQGTEAAAQVVVALCALGLDPDGTPSFTKYDDQGQKYTPLSYMLASYRKIQAEDALSPLLIEQTLCALAAYDRFSQEKSPLYDMTGEGSHRRETFADLDGHWAESSIEATKGFGITNGMSGSFKPDRAITRAEFCVAVVNAFGLSSDQNSIVFSDVSPKVWYQKQIGAAAGCGIIKGRGEGLFDPEGAITRQEAMAIIQRTAQHFGQNTAMSLNDISMYLAKYPDGPGVAWWAMGPAGFNLKTGIIVGKDGRIAPEESITRAETVAVVERLLRRLNKLSSY